MSISVPDIERQLKELNKAVKVIPELYEDIAGLGKEVKKLQKELIRKNKYKKSENKAAKEMYDLLQEYKYKLEWTRKAFEMYVAKEEVEEGNDADALYKKIKYWYTCGKHWQLFLDHDEILEEFGGDDV